MPKAFVDNATPANYKPQRNGDGESERTVVASDVCERELRILIIANLRIYREGLARCITANRGFGSVIVDTSYAGAIECVSQALPDVVLLDVSAPEAIPLVRALRSLAPECKVVAVGVEDSDEAVLDFAQAGVASFVTRDESIEALIATVHRSNRNEIVWSPRRMALACQRLAKLGAATSPSSDTVELTARERQIVACIDRGMSNKQIAAELGIEVATVKNHVHRMLEKLQVSRRGEAAARVRHSHPYRQLSSEMYRRL